MSRKKFIGGAVMSAALMLGCHDWEINEQNKANCATEQNNRLKEIAEGEARLQNEQISLPEGIKNRLSAISQTAHELASKLATWSDPKSNEINPAILTYVDVRTRIGKFPELPENSNEGITTHYLIACERDSDAMNTAFARLVPHPEKEKNLSAIAKTTLETCTSIFASLDKVTLPIFSVDLVDISTDSIVLTTWKKKL